MTYVAPIICLVTDRRRLAPGASLEVQMDRLAAQAEEAARAGIGVIQLRERDLEGAALVLLARRLIEAAAPARIVVNDRGDVALAAGAHGVHLRSDSYDAGRLRGLAPAGWLVGRSIHTPAEATAAGETADYLVFGAVYPTASKPGGPPPAGVPALREAAARARAPVLAIGGVSVARLPEIAAAGSAGVAAIELFLPPTAGVPGRPGIAAAVSAIRAAFGAGVD
ncbi:MAG: thiamine phosphate synthase [Vicinamibacterales bacterium]